MNLTKKLSLILGALVTVLALAACGSGAGTPATSASAPAASGWSYTDDTGATITLDHKPERVAGFADQVLSLLSYGVQPVAVFGRVDVKNDPRFAGYDLSQVKIVGNAYGEIDLEALAEAEPDLIVTAVYPSDREGTIDAKSPYYGLKDLEQQKKILDIAPVAAVKVGGKGLDVIESNAKLAVALGADQAKVDADRAAFATASTKLTAAAGESGLEVTVMYADADGIYLVKPEDEPQTQLYKSLGVKLTELKPEGPYYWDIYSWENAGTVMSGDIILLSVEGFQSDDLKKQATFAKHPALQAGQVFPNAYSSMDYSSQAKLMDQLAGWLTESKKV
ncbi:MAG TPA: ABC transporter substrate-binding protein [Micropruina sp.]|nr:ABC transporter substrate-binding protein [Propionibacterium sp.]HMR21378.1 ABC transporter substrate-binding protein [Micropruina sp.]